MKNKSKISFKKKNVYFLLTYDFGPLGVWSEEWVLFGEVVT